MWAEAGRYLGPFGATDLGVGRAPIFSENSQGHLKRISREDCLSSTLVVSPSGKNGKYLYQGIRHTEPQLQYCHVLLGGAKQIAPLCPFHLAQSPAPKADSGRQLGPVVGGVGSATGWLLLSLPKPVSVPENGDNDGVPISWLCYKDEKGCHM